MKKLIITLFCIFTFAFCLKTYSQVDTANWSFKTNGSDGKYTMLQNRGTFQGKAAGTVVVPFTMDINAVDTSKFLFVPIGSDGTYRLVENKSTFMGKDSGTVRAQLTYGVGTPNFTTYGVDIDTTGGSFNITANTYAGEITYSNSNITPTLIPANSTIGIALLNNKLTANSKLIVTIQQYSDGTLLVARCNVNSGQANIEITNVKEELNTSFTIRFFITN